MSWTRVDAWRTELRKRLPDVGLSEPATRFALDTALEALDAIPQHLDRRAPPHTVLVCASTVFTAPLEWAAVLLARGGRVTFKSPQNLAPWFEHVAACTDLPLASTTDRAVLDTADCIVAMGSDATLAAIRANLAPHQRLLGFGHRYSLAWWSDPAQADAVALDLALYDGRGCMTPLGIFSPIPDAAVLLGAAMERLETRLPRGILAPIEGARLRERDALTRVLGEVHAGPRWAVHTLPAARFPESSLPRAAVLHPSDLAGFMATVRAHQATLSTVGSDTPLEDLGDTRVVPLGDMQRPRLERLHDGVDWLRVL